MTWFKKNYNKISYTDPNIAKSSLIKYLLMKVFIDGVPACSVCFELCPVLPTDYCYACHLMAHTRCLSVRWSNMNWHYKCIKCEEESL